MQPDRIDSIDQFRGFAILAMALANYMGGVELIPAWLKHADDIGLTMIDLIAPVFIFTIGLTYGLSFQRRIELQGRYPTYSRFATRYLAILGMGAILSAGQTALGENTSGIDWGVLQSIGVAGMVTLLLIHLPPVIRWTIGMVLLLVYQLILEGFLLDLTLRSPHGGLFGSLSWSAMLILATALADLYHAGLPRRKWFPWASLGLLASGILIALFWPISKNRVSASYVLVSLAASALLFLVFDWISCRFHWRNRFLAAWGRNPLFLYFLHYLVIGLFFLPGIPELYASASLPVVLLEIAILIGVLTTAAFWLERRIRVILR